MEEQDERARRKSNGRRVIEESIYYIFCILGVTCHAGYNIISKIALDKGMSYYVLVVYGYVFATLTTALLAFIFERNNESKMTIPVLRNILTLGFLRAILATTLHYVGLDYTSPTITSALANTIPSITFILAVFFRMEKFEMSKCITQAKIWGTVIAFGGATIMSFYKGVTVLSIHGSKHSNSGSSAYVGTVDSKWIKGALSLLISNISFSAFFILQTATVKAYPAPMTLTSLVCLAGIFLSAIMAAIVDHKASSWKLTWDITLLAPLYSGVVIFGVITYLQTLVLRKKGPVFVTAFGPLSTLIVAIMSLLILAEALHLGSILGAVLIVIGMYALLWGKKKEIEKIPSEVIIAQDIEIKTLEK